MEWLFCIIGMGSHNFIVPKLIATYQIDRCVGELMDLINPETTYSETMIG